MILSREGISWSDAIDFLPEETFPWKVNLSSEDMSLPDMLAFLPALIFQ